MSTQPRTLLTPEQYLEIERKAEFRSEYLNGEMFAMSGASRWHGRIISNIHFGMRKCMEGRPCDVFTTDMRVRTRPAGLYTYPDVAVVCGEPRFADDQFDVLLNPIVIVEVLSESTKNYDRVEKFEQYRSIESLVEYVLVAQNAFRVEKFARQADGSWKFTEITDPAGTLALDSITCELPLSEIYYRVEFPAG